jgi:hypothetical protein
MRKLLTFLIALALISAVAPVNAQLSGGLMFPGPGAPAASGGRTCTDDTASTNFLARTSGLSNTEKDAYCNLIKGLESDSIITGNLSGAAGCGTVLDALYIFATNTTTTANLNLCGTNSGLTQHGTVTFTADTGYTGDGSTGYLDTGFIPSSAGGNYTQNNASFGSYVLSNRTTSNAAVEIGAFGSGIYAFMQPMLGAGPIAYGYDINDSTFPVQTNTTTKGAWVNSRNASSTTINVYLNGSTTPFATASATSTGLPNSSFFIGGFDNAGSLADPSPDQIAAAFIGGALSSTQSVAINNRINTFMTIFSHNVY